MIQESPFKSSLIVSLGLFVTKKLTTRGEEQNSSNFGVRWIKHFMGFAKFLSTFFDTKKLQNHPTLKISLLVNWSFSDFRTFINPCLDIAF